MRERTCRAASRRASRRRARALPDTDWHVEKLFAFARRVGATLLVRRRIRAMSSILNRDPSGRALYPGADNTELCPTRTFANEPIYAEGDAPDFAKWRSAAPSISRPYHAVLAAEIERVRARHGYAILLDGHSIRREVPRFFAGRLPDLNLGTADGASCAPAFQHAAALVLAGAARFHQCRQRPLQGRLHHPPLRRPRPRRPRAPARDRAARATWTSRRRTRGTRSARPPS